MLLHSPLGQKSAYVQTYSPELLFPLARVEQRNSLGIETWAFPGFDLWHGYELSWLNPSGKPVVALAEFIFPCQSPYLIESKSFKLYLNSFNQTTFESMMQVQETLQRDLTRSAGDSVIVNMHTLDQMRTQQLQHFSGICLDEQAITCDVYDVNADYIHTHNEAVEETVYSHLLKSNCPVTGQPDWASIAIDYRGKKIDHADLLRYIISFRNHQDFHEHCIERIFMDIFTRAQPEKLTVRAYYTRRGGLDINPIRSTEHDLSLHLMRLWRQ